MWVRALWKHTVGKSTQLRGNNKLVLSHCYQQLLSTPKSGLSSASDLVKLNCEPNEEPYVLTKDQEKFVTKGVTEKETRLGEIRLDLFLKRQQGLTLPSVMELRDFDAMLDMSSHQLIKYLNFVCKRGYRQESGLRKKEMKRKELEARREEDKLTNVENEWLTYRLFRNALFLRFPKMCFNSFSDVHAGLGLQFGQKVVIDCGFESFMNRESTMDTAKQIIYSYVCNRKNRRPFSLHLCNLNTNGQLMHFLRLMHPTIETDANIIIHSCSYINVFDRQRLVYISPDARPGLNYDPNDTYILAGLVDRRLESKKLGLKRALKDKALGMLLDVKNTGDWPYAIKQNIPARRFINDD